MLVASPASAVGVRSNKVRGIGENTPDAHDKLKGPCKDLDDVPFASALRTARRSIATSASCGSLATSCARASSGSRKLDVSLRRTAGATSTPHLPDGDADEDADFDADQHPVADANRDRDSAYGDTD